MASVEIEKLADPPERGTVASDVLPSKNVMVPVELDAETAADMLTFWPNSAGFGVTERNTDIGGGAGMLTTCVTEFDVLLANCESPPYTAVRPCGPTPNALVTNVATPLISCP